jgi:hypothetical protein
LFRLHSWTLEFFRLIVIAMLEAGRGPPHPADRKSQTALIETSAML